MSCILSRRHSFSVLLLLFFTCSLPRISNTASCFPKILRPSCPLLQPFSRWPWLASSSSIFFLSYSGTECLRIIGTYFFTSQLPFLSLKQLYQCTNESTALMPCQPLTWSYPFCPLVNYSGKRFLCQYSFPSWYFLVMVGWQEGHAAHRNLGSDLQNISYNHLTIMP